MKQVIKILLLAANPKDSSPLRLDEEMRSIDQALRQAEFRDKFEINQHWAVRIADLQGYFLRYKPDIVHFSGHGSTLSEIILEDNDGNSHPVSRRALTELFTILKDNIRCVILNSCYSHDQAQAISKEIDCVIGMSRAIGDSAAIRFAAAFYQALGFGRDVKTAFDLGCLQIDLESLNEQDIPQLLAINSNPREIVFAQESVLPTSQFNIDTTAASKTSKLSFDILQSAHSTTGYRRKEDSKRKLFWTLASTGLIALTLASILLWKFFNSSKPTDQTVILVANFEGPEPQNYRVTESIIEQLREATKSHHNIDISALGRVISASEGSHIAKIIGEKHKATIVLWGWYGRTEEKALITAHFDVLQKPRYLPLLSEKKTLNIVATELETFKIQIQLSREMSYLAMLTIGFLRYEAGNYGSAIALFNEALDQTTGSIQFINPAVIYFRRGSAYLAQGEIDKARVDFNHAIALKPDYAFAYINRGSTFLEKGKPDSAIVDYTKAIELRPHDPDVYNNMGVAYDEMIDYEKAITNYSYAIMLKPDYIFAYINRAIAYHKRGQLDSAITDYQHAIKLDPKNSDLYNNLGIAYDEKGDHKNAVINYDRAIELRPTDADAYNNRAVSYSVNGDRDRAIKDFKQAILFNPTDSTAYYNIAIAQRDTKVGLESNAKRALKNSTVMNIKLDKSKMILKLIRKRPLSKVAGVKR